MQSSQYFLQFTCYVGHLFAGHRWAKENTLPEKPLDLTLCLSPLRRHTTASQSEMFQPGRRGRMLYLSKFTCGNYLSQVVRWARCRWLPAPALGTPRLSASWQRCLLSGDRSVTHSLWTRHGGRSERRRPATLAAGVSGEVGTPCWLQGPEEGIVKHPVVSLSGWSDQPWTTDRRTDRPLGVPQKRVSSDAGGSSYIQVSEGCDV